MERARSKLAQARARKYWTLEQAAERLGVSKGALNGWELGKTKPYPYNVERLCAVYGATAEELGLEPGSKDTQETGAVPVSHILEHAKRLPEDFQAFLAGNLTTRLTTLASTAHRSFADLQDSMTCIIEEYDAMNIGDAAAMTRRDALRHMAVISLVALPFNENHILHAVEDILMKGAAMLTACWELSKSDHDDDLVFAFNGVSTLLPILKVIVKDSPKHLQAASSLIGQCELLRTLLGWHLQGLKEAARYAQEAVKYSELAGDNAMYLSTLDYLAWVYHYDNQPKQALSAIEKALPKINENKKRGAPLSSRLLGGVYCTLALMSARNGQSGLPYLRQATTNFFSEKNTDDRFVYMDYTKADLVLNDGMVHYYQREYQKAQDSLEQLIDPESLKTKLVLPERSRIEALNIMALTQLKNPKKDQEKSLYIWQNAIQGAIDLQSEQRFTEALAAYHVMEALWPGDKKIEEMRELTMAHW